MALLNETIIVDGPELLDGSLNNDNDNNNSGVIYAINRDLLDVIHKICEDSKDNIHVCARYTSVLDSLYENSSAHGHVMAATFGGRFVPYSVLSCLAVLFNTLSIGVMLNIRAPHWSCHHVLLLNLAVCDIVGTVLLWMYHNSPTLFPQFRISTLSHCVFISMVLVAPFILTLCNSSGNLLLLAVNLYLAICHPLLTVSSVNKRVLRVTIGVIWGASLTLASIPLLIMLSRSHAHGDCAAYAVDMGVKSLEISAYVLVAVICVPIVLYVRIYHVISRYKTCGRVHHHHQQTRAQNNDQNQVQEPANNRDSNYKAFLTTLLLVGSLFIFWLPYLVFHFITAHLDIDVIPDAVLNIKFYFVDFLPVLHFLTDPAIYGLRITEIRRGYKRLLCPLDVKHPRGHHPQQHRSSIETRVTLLSKHHTSTCESTAL